MLVRLLLGAADAILVHSLSCECSYPRTLVGVLSELWEFSPLRAGVVKLRARQCHLHCRLTMALCVLAGAIRSMLFL